MKPAKALINELIAELNFGVGPITYISDSLKIRSWRLVLAFTVPAADN